MKRILLIVAKNIEAGGVETYLLNVLNQINRDNLEIEILVPGRIISQERANEFCKLGCHFHVLDIKESGIKSNFELLRGIYNVLLSKEYNVVHVNTGSLKVESIGLFLAKRTKVKTRIAHSHGTLLQCSWLKEFLRTVLRGIIIHNANEFLACSHTAAESLVGRRYSNNVKIAKNGIKTDAYRFNNEIREKIRTQYGWSNRFVIGIIARISPEKNHLFLLRIIKRLCCKDSRSLLVIIGNGDSKYEKQIFDEIRNLNIQDYVQFLGEQDNINELVQGLDLHILPSIREAFPIVNIEAQASGLHCICSDRVPNETNITGLVEFIPLEKGEGYWSEQIQLYDNYYKREDTTSIIKAHGYDISSSAQIISNLYNS